MEPMTLGSPGGSPAGGSPYLPSFLMGDSNQPTTPRNNTLSPTKGGRTVSFVSPSGITSPQDYSRQNIEQRGIFNQLDTPTRGNFPGTPAHGSNTSISGPPTQGLFDLLRAERNEVQTPTKISFNMNQSSHIGTPGPSSNINQSFNESYLNHTGLNSSRIVSPVAQLTSPDYRSNLGMNMLNCAPTVRHNDFWITVFGFPQSATNMILSHFSQCGTIIDKVFPTQSGNWVHLKFSSRLECDKALNYNEKILGNIMIGVTYCKDTSIVDKENLCDNNQMSRVRPLAQVAYKTAQCDSAVVACPTAPQRSSGIVNKAMDLLFGW